MNLNLEVPFLGYSFNQILVCGISDFKSTKDAIDSLTSREREVLMERFGIREMVTDAPPAKPPGSNGNGGASAPADPPR